MRRPISVAVTAISSAAIAVGSISGFRRIIVFKRRAVSLDLLVQVCDLFVEPIARENAGLACIAMEEGAVDRNNCSADKAKFSNQQHETAAHRLQGLPVLLAEVGDRSITRLQVFEQPDQFQVATRFPLQPTRRPDLVDVSVKVELQQIGWIVGRLPHFRTAVRMTEPELCKLERANLAIDRAYRIVRPYIVINPGRKKTGLLTAFAALECMIRHKPNRTSTPENVAILAQPRRAVC